MISSIRGKKPHVYRVIILKQMADHTGREGEGNITVANHAVELYLMQYKGKTRYSRF